MVPVRANPAAFSEERPNLVCPIRIHNRAKQKAHALEFAGRFLSAAQ